MKSCFFIGHREASAEILPALRNAVEQHIVEYGVTEFVVGHYGGFDHMAARAVIDAKVRHPEITLSMLIPYHPAERTVDIIIDVQEALNNDEFSHALRIADSIDYQRYDVEMERKWDLEKEYWVEKVLTEAAEHGVDLEYTPSSDIDIVMIAGLSCSDPVDGTNYCSSIFLRNEMKQFLSNSEPPNHICRNMD